MGRVIYGIYIGTFILSLMSCLISKDTEVLQSAVNVLNEYNFFELCVATLLYDI